MRGDRLWNAGVRLGADAAERGLVPDAWLRRVIRRLCAQRLAQERALGPAERAARLAALAGGPIALAPDSANAQHYEVPPAFFETVLGPRLKYSACLYEPGVADLAAAEEAMLARSVERAGLEDGMTLLDLGCGWGSLSLWVAEHLPRCRILAVSNSKLQREHLATAAARRGFERLRVVTADANAFDPSGLAGPFDRVISVEMFEHVRNWPALLARVRSWLAPDGRLFLHHFAHRELVYPFEDAGANDWMARHFFTGGLMPSADFAARTCPGTGLAVEARWTVGGRHYARTCEDWLARLDAARERVLAIFAEAGRGRGDAQRWLGRWRLFFLACAELFAYDGGHEWLVSHARLAPTPGSRGAA